MKIFLPFLVLFFALILQGCVISAFIGTAAIGTKAFIDPRTVGTQIDDNILELRIKSALLKNKQLKKGTHINVIAYKKRVLLVGQVLNPNLSFYAKNIALGIEGTNEVFNEIRKCQPINIKTALLDTWITAKVLYKLLISDLVKFSNVKVITENGEVFFLGLVTEREGKAAAKISSHVSGVKSVTTIFTYIK